MEPRLTPAFIATSSIDTFENPFSRIKAAAVSIDNIRVRALLPPGGAVAQRMVTALMAPGNWTSKIFCVPEVSSRQPALGNGDCHSVPTIIQVVLIYKMYILSILTAKSRVLRCEPTDEQSGRSNIEAIKSDEVRAKYLAAYDAQLRHGPSVHEVRFVQTGFGRTHVVVSGAADAPPLALLHAFQATSGGDSMAV